MPARLSLGAVTLPVHRLPLISLLAALAAAIMLAGCGSGETTEPRTASNSGTSHAPISNAGGEDPAAVVVDYFNRVAARDCAYIELQTPGYSESEGESVPDCEAFLAGTRPSVKPHCSPNDDGDLECVGPGIDYFNGVFRGADQCVTTTGTTTIDGAKAVVEYAITCPHTDDVPGPGKVFLVGENDWLISAFN